MLKFFNKSSSYDSHYFLALDIGTEFVKALLCESQGKKGVIIGAGKKRQKLGEMQSGSITDIAQVIQNCNEAIKDAEKMAGISANQLVLGIAGEHVKGATTDISYTRTNPEEKIDLSELKNIVHKVQWKAFDQVRAQLAYETGYNEIDVKLVNAALVDVRIDGYKVTNPIGFQGKEVTISIFNAFSPLVHFGALQTIAAELNMDLLAITSEPYAVSRSLRQEDGRDFSAIFIDMGGGTTDIAVTRNGACEGTKMFTLGGKTFTKRLAQFLNISFEEAEDIKIAYSNDKLEKNSSRIVREAMQSDSEIWLSGAALTLSEFYNIDILPPKIFLSGGGCHLPEIKEILETQDWFSKLPFAKKPQVDFLLPKQILSLIDKTGKLKDVEDITPMALANLGLDYIGEEQIISKLLKKVVRLMQI